MLRWMRQGRSLIFFFDLEGVSESFLLGLLASLLVFTGNRFVEPATARLIDGVYVSDLCRCGRNR